jgi:hypothetical protein
VTLTLRTMNRHAKLMGWGDRWGEDGYLVGSKPISWAHLQRHARRRTWCWSINTSPHPAHRRTTASPKLSTAKQEFKTRYEEMKRMGVRPFG